MFLIRPVWPADQAVVARLLTEAGLSAHGILAPHTRYWIAEAEGTPAGVIGLEVGASAGLLRSAAVQPRFRGRRLAHQLTATVIAWARTHGLTRVYLFSTEAGAFWERLGFQLTPVAEVAAALPEAPQVKHYSDNGWLPNEVAYAFSLNRDG